MSEEQKKLSKGQRTPSQEIADQAKKGLDLRREFKRGGTSVGLSRARDLKNKKSLSLKTLKRMRSYFKRHAVDKKSKNFGNDKDPSKGYIAWLLWGGDAGEKWVNGLSLD